MSCIKNIKKNLIIKITLKNKSINQSISPRVNINKWIDQLVKINKQKKTQIHKIDRIKRLIMIIK